MKFSAMLVFMVLWSLMVYAPMAHMVWGKGGLLNASLGGRFPTLDFAGGTVVHITSGVSALVCALYLGSGWDIRRSRCRPTVWYSALSAHACCGWAGLDSMPAARSARAAWRPARLSPHISAAATAAIGWAVAEWIRNGKPSVLGAISGCVAGLVAITPAAGFRRPDVGTADRPDRRSFLLLHGGRGEGAFGYDDSLDAFGVHGAGGTIGALLTGVFATS